MPLRLRCKCCGRNLLLDEAFQGAHCRCQYCRSLVLVPRQSQFAAVRPQTRPDRPPLAGSLRRAYKRQKPGARISSPSSRHPLVASITTFRAVACLVVVGAIGLGVTAWTLTGYSGGTFSFGFGSSLFSGSGSESEVDELRLAILSGDPRTSFFGIPIHGGRIGYVVDSDLTMAEAYIEPVASILATVNDAIEPGARRYGIVQAVSDPNSLEMREILEPVIGFPGASAFLHPRLAGGTTNLSGALAVAQKWHADQIFLVLSKSIDQAEIERLTQHAEQSGAMTHVIALGQAAHQDLSPISKATGGQFCPVQNSVLSELVQRCEEAAGS
ncbi:MAG: hypothetical protein MI923_10950 [Phycisphaerales bacterium]|nr:hypothetical protein [Phycisphaerales bacterium]